MASTTAAVLSAYEHAYTFLYQQTATNELLLVADPKYLKGSSAKTLEPGITITVGESADVRCYLAQDQSTIGFSSYPPPPNTYAVGVMTGIIETITAPSNFWAANKAQQTPATTSPITSVSITTSLNDATTLSSSQVTASTPPTAHSLKSSKSGVAGGAVAGVAIGCLIAGAAIAGFIVWLLMRRSKNRSQLGFQHSAAVGQIRHEKQPILGDLAKGSSDSTLRTIENNLPQPLEDNAISGDITKLSTLIKNHVQSYYHQSMVAARTVDLDALQALGDHLPISIGTLGTLLSNPTTREVGLRFCIAWVIVSRIKFSGDPRTTLLPPEIVQCMLSMTALDGKPQVRDAFLRSWRAITSELMQTSYLRNAFAPYDARNHNILRATEVLEAILFPYADTRMDRSTRRRNLEEIVKRAATFAFVLFSQPSSWRLEWPDAQSMAPGSLVVFPALEQLSDEEGRAFSPPRIFSEMIVRQIDG